MAIFGKSEKNLDLGVSKGALYEYDNGLVQNPQIFFPNQVLEAFIAFISFFLVFLKVAFFSFVFQFYQSCSEIYEKVKVSKEKVFEVSSENISIFENSIRENR